MGKSYIIQIVVRIALIVINTLIIIWSYQSTYVLNTIGFGLVLIFQVFLLIDYFKKQYADVEKALDCLLHDDYSNTISEKKRKLLINDKAARLLEKNRKENLQKVSEEIIFTNIIESLSIGILILRKDPENNVEIFQINKAFTEFLKIPKYHNWDLLKEKINPLSKFISEWRKMRHVVSLKINDETESFFLKTSITQTNNYQYLIASLETIQQLIDKKEKEAWFKLMNVMSHEIINTITPISSLAENLETLLQEETADKETLNELSQGLQIIKKRSYHLTSFVDTYRKLAELPLPQKESLNLTELVNSTLDLFEQEFKVKHIKIEIEATEEYIVEADKKQIEQVLINIISNAIYALEPVVDKQLKIKIEGVKNRTNISIIDNGVGIPDEIKDNIFIPYFTTRKNGSGIGLTLAKSIMEAHNSTILFKSNNGQTSFTLSFQ